MEGTERRLAAIVVADVVGFSRMTALDEEGTLSALRAHRNEIDPVILNHGGRIVKTTGDGLLVEFPSATAAVEASVEVQDLMTVRNEGLPESRRMQFRVGINLAEVVVDETGDILGDGVNIAARVEGEADPGGVSVTDSLHDAVAGKVDIGFVDDGEHDLKNIPRPVRIWKVGTAPSRPRATQVTAERVLATVAVLPFENMSGDQEQEYFADGITEDLLTALSYDKDIAVIPRNSTFAYKERPVDIRTCARELDATHVVEGSVRRAANRVRVTAQLVDAETGHQMWAERYDRDLDDVFELQDELVESITARLRPSLWESAGERRVRAGGTSVNAWDLTIQGQYHFNKHTPEDFLRSIELFDEARQLDPGLVLPVARSASAWGFLAFSGWRKEGVNPLERALADTEAAYRLDPNDYDALGMKAATGLMTGNPADGVVHARRMIELNPHGSLGHHMLGVNLAGVGEIEEGITASTTAWRLGRHEWIRYDIASDLAYAHYLAGNYEAARTWGNQSLQLVPGYLQAHIALAAACGQLGRADEARRHADAVLEMRPGFRSSRYRSRIMYQRDEDRDHIVEGLQKAGLPD